MADAATLSRDCIVGAGAAGITAAKNLKAFNIPFEVFEREDDIGGNWYYGKSASAAYKSTHLISSKTMTAYTDFPMPADFPDYPNHAQVLDYLRRYARRFDLYPSIQFNTSVDRIARTPEGVWEVTISGANGVETRTYRGVIIANGHLTEPRFPTYPGAFGGVTLHSKDYKTPDILRDKRVLVIGAGNSGCDIAVEAAQTASRVFHSTRRGYHYIPKYVMGQPTDVFGELGNKLRLPLPVRRAINSFFLNLVMGDPSRFGLPKPDHRLLEAHPVVNSQMLYFVGHGDITPKPDVKELRGGSVLFVDGTEEPIDIIVYATGYKIHFPFIDASHLNWQEGAPGPNLYLHAFHPQYDNLFVVGLLQPDSGVLWLMDYQAQLIARFVHAQDAAPGLAQAFRIIKSGPQPDMRGGANTLNTVRHYLEIDHFAYKRIIQRLISRFRLPQPAPPTR